MTLRDETEWRDDASEIVRPRPYKTVKATYKTVKEYGTYTTVKAPYTTGKAPYKTLKGVSCWVTLRDETEWRDDASEIVRPRPYVLLSSLELSDTNGYAP